MINFNSFTLSNGLKVLVHQDKNTALAVVNILYRVGARNEHPDKTGFAHLFEHLMFGGSVNIPDYDSELQKIGGENNAFTNNDITNYYLTVPANNIETAFWLESDRMLQLAFSPKSLSVQKKVVCEEFKERYLNQPYGDVWLKLRPLAYQIHPYRWSTIGKSLSHIKKVGLDDVKRFFKKFYCPSNAIMVVAGNVSVHEVKRLSKKWFENIPSGKKNNHQLPKEPVQNNYREITLKRNVPADAVYKVYHMCSRYDKEYHATDLLSDLLSKGDSSRLYLNLVKQKNLFSEINAYISGCADEGLFVVEGKLQKNIAMKEAEQEIEMELDHIKRIPPELKELNKVKNQAEASQVLSRVNVLHRAMNLAFAEFLGNANSVNTEMGKYMSVTPKDITKTANRIFRKENCSTLYYLAKL